MSIPESTPHSTYAELWGALDMGRWLETPCIVGRVATLEDIREGRAAFSLGEPETIGAQFVDIGLPRCAFWTDENKKPIPVIIIQSESAGDKHYIGFRFLDGGNGVGFMFEFQLLDQPDNAFKTHQV